MEMGYMKLSVVGALLVSMATVATAAEAVPHRQLRVCVADDAPQVVREAARRVLDASGTQVLLAEMAGGESPGKLRDTTAMLKGKLAERAFNHLVIVGLMQDPLVAAVWQRESLIEGQTMYAFGFGHLKGDLGYIESDRNPFLHGIAVKAAPFEAEIIVLTGTTPAGVAAAVGAFLDKGIVNGVINAGTWNRQKRSLLDRDPLAAGDRVPAWVPKQIGGWKQVGATQPGEDEYRGVLADAGVSPSRLWRVKYYRSGEWDKGGSDNAIQVYMAGLHRRAYGNTLWIAEFASVDQARAASALIEKKAGTQVVRRDAWLIMSSAQGMDLKPLGSAD